VNFEIPEEATPNVPVNVTVKPVVLAAAIVGAVEPGFVPHATVSPENPDEYVADVMVTVHCARTVEALSPYAVNFNDLPIHPASPVDEDVVFASVIATEEISKAPAPVALTKVLAGARVI
jgi:hypothetical protein